MNAQQLRNSILQEAIEGRLVPQDPNDEPASELLNRIRAEKERLVKAGKRKKKDLEETPISEDEKPFEIPESWEWVRLKDIIRGTSAGKSPNCEKRPKSGNEWGVITTTAIQYCSFSPNENKVLPSRFIINELQIVKDKDLLITRAGPKNRTGIVCVVDKPCDNLILSDKTIRIDYFRRYCNPFFLMFALNNPTIHDNIMSATVGMAESQVNISQSSIQNIVIPLPPLAEQKRIVAKIEELLPKVEEYGKAQDALNKLNEELPEKLKKSILQEAIEGRLVPQDPNDEPASALLERIREEKKRLLKEGKLKKKDLEETPISEDEKPFEIPESWEWCKFGNVISLLSGRDLTPQEYSDKEGDIPYITGASNFDGNSLIINRWTTKPVTISKYGDLLITCKGTIGTMSFNQIGDIHIARQVMAISPYIVNIRYIRYFLMRIVYELEKKAKSIIPGISREDIINAKFPLPPLAEQKRIVAKIEEVFAEIDKLKK